MRTVGRLDVLTSTSSRTSSNSVRESTQALTASVGMRARSGHSLTVISSTRSRKSVHVGQRRDEERRWIYHRRHRRRRRRQRLKPSPGMIPAGFLAFHHVTNCNVTFGYSYNLLHLQICNKKLQVVTQSNCNNISNSNQLVSTSIIPQNWNISATKPATKAKECNSSPLQSFALFYSNVAFGVQFLAII